MPFLGRLLAVLGLDNSEFNRKFDQSTNKIRRTGEAMEDLGRRMTFSMSVPMAGFGAAALKAAGGIEAMKIGFTTLLKSQERSGVLFNEIRDYALQTQFSLEGVGLSARKLLAVGIAADEVVPKIRKIGDAVVAIGGGQVEMDRIIRAMTQMSQKSKASAEEINQQLAEVGLNGWKYLADYFGKSTGEIQQAVQKGLIGGKEAAMIIIDGMGKEFEGASKRMVGSINQTWENMKESTKLALADVGMILAPYFKRFKIEFFDPFLSSVKELASAFSSLPKEVQNVAVKYALAFTAAPVILAAIGSMITNLGLLRTTLAGIGLKMGPVGWTVTVLLLLTPVLTEAWDKITNGRSASGAFPGATWWEGMQSAGIGNVSKSITIATNAMMEADIKAATLAKSSKAAATGVRSLGDEGEKAAKKLKFAEGMPFGSKSAENLLLLDKYNDGLKKMKDLADQINKLRASGAGTGLLGEGPEMAANVEQYGVRVKKVYTDSLTYLGHLQEEMNQAALAAYRLADAGKALTGIYDQVGLTSEQREAAKKAKEHLDEVERNAKQAFDRTVRLVDNYARRIARSLTDVWYRTTSLGEAFRTLATEIGKALMEFAIIEGFKLLIRNLDGVLSKMGQLGKLLGAWGNQSVLVSGTGAAGTAIGGAGSAAGGVSGSIGGIASGAISGAMGWVTGISSAVSAVFQGLQYFQQRRMEQDIGRIEVTSRSIFSQTLALQETANHQAAILQDIYGYFWGPQLTVLVEINNSIQSLKGNMGGPGGSHVNVRDFMDAVIRELKLAGGYAFA